MIHNPPDHALRRAERVGINASHRICTGTTVTNGRNTFPQPIPGFVVRFNSRAGFSSDAPMPIDYDVMQVLGCSREAADAAMKLGRNTVVGTIPQFLEIVIVGDAVRKEKPRPHWTYPGFFDGSYAALYMGKSEKKPFPFWLDPAWKDSKGPERPCAFCTGDGETARRLQPDGSYRMVPCAPAGAVSPHPVCEFSKAGFCDTSATLCVFLVKRDADGRLSPVVRNTGARFALHTKSVHNYLAVKTELDAAADKLDGRISGLGGTITGGLVKTVDHTGRHVVVHRFTLHLDPLMIADRIAQLRGQRPLLGGPVSVASPGRLPQQPAAKAEPMSKPVVHKDGDQDAEFHPRHIGAEDYATPEYSTDVDAEAEVEAESEAEPATVAPAPAPPPPLPSVDLPARISGLSPDELLAAARRCTELVARAEALDFGAVVARDWYVEKDGRRVALNPDAMAQALANPQTRDRFTVALRMVAARLYASHFTYWPVTAEEPR